MHTIRKSAVRMENYQRRLWGNHLLKKQNVKKKFTFFLHFFARGL